MSTPLLDNLNPEQMKAVTHENGQVLIVAGAGTGKTTVITKRIAWLIEQEKAKSDEILALTFTDKAAGEMEERVDQLLPYGYFDLWISTFHSFCDRILRDYALDIGLANNYKLLNTTEQWMLVKKNLDRFNLDYYRPFGNPTKFIHALIKHFSRCKDEGISPEDYLEYAESVRLNQDNAESGALKNQKSKIKNQKYNSKMKNDSKLKDSSILIFGEDINGLDLKKLEEVANAYHVYQQILLENDALDFGDLINCALKLFKERPNILEMVRKKFNYILVDEFQDTNWVQYELIKLLAAPLNNITCVADDDQSIYLFRGSSVNNVLQFAKDYPECEEIVLTQNYRSRQDILDLSYKFIQQNNPNRLEYELNRDEIMIKRAKEKGIDIADYKKINKKLKANTPGKAIIEHLHRESLEDEVDAVIKKVLSIKYQVSSGEKQKGIKKLENDGNSPGATVLSADDSANASSPLSCTIAPSARAAVSWSDFAILVRANDSAKPFITGLERAGIPYQFYSLRGLYNKPIILDILSYFKLLDNYHETISLYRVLNLPMWRLPYDNFSKLNYAAFKNGKSLYQIIRNPELINGLSKDTINTLNTLTGLVEKHSKLSQEKNISIILNSFLHDSGYLNYLIKNEDENRKNFKFLNQFLKKIKDFESVENDPKLKNFMEQIEMEIEAGDEGTLSIDPDVGPDMIKIMTIHSAKGLEFPYVFIINLVDKKFPTIERKEPIEIPDPLVKEILPDGDIHLQEERRLFYVAMTRAKNGLFFTSAENYGGLRKKKNSRFLKELFPSIENNLQSVALKPSFHELYADLPFACAGMTQAGSNTDSTRKLAMPASNNNYTLPQKFSYTQLAAFEKCPLQYKFAHILRIPIKGKSTFSFGKTMHRTLQRFFALMKERQGGEQAGLFDEIKVDKARNASTEKDLLKIYEECWIDEWYEDDKQREEKKKAGRQALKEFYEIHKGNWPNVLYLEQGFNLKIGNFSLRGVIDRIDIFSCPNSNNKHIEIVDYKTGNIKDEDKLTLENKEQLLIYQIAAVECLGLNPQKLTFYYIEKNKAVSFLGTQEELDKIKLGILEKIEKIRTSAFNPTPGWQCEWCDYKEICEHRNY